MFLFRWIVSLPFAVLVTVGLFITMAALIRDRQEPIVDPVPSRKIDITRQKTDSDLREIVPPREVIPEKQPPTDFDFPPLDGPAPGPAPRPEPREIDRTPPDTGRFPSAIIKIPPPYPENCRSRGVEGVVVVEFDVTPEGNVSNPRVTSSPNVCFNRTVIKAVSGWKYPPASGGGMRYGLVETFNFQLEE